MLLSNHECGYIHERILSITLYVTISNNIASITRRILIVYSTVSATFFQIAVGLLTLQASSIFLHADWTDRGFDSHVRSQRKVYAGRVVLPFCDGTESATCEEP